MCLDCFRGGELRGFKVYTALWTGVYSLVVTVSEKLQEI